MTTLILTQSQVRSVLNMRDVVQAVEEAFAAHARGQTKMPSKIYLSLSEYEGDFRAMPAYMQGAAGIKWVNAHPRNPAGHKLPSVMALYILNDPANALPLAVMDATIITAYRTGAAAAVASKALARKDAKSIGFVGSGVQARFALEAHREQFPELSVFCADVIPEAAQKFAAEHGGKAVSLEEACGCDIVCTTTPVRQPVVKREWVKKGCHINALGADAPGKQELDTALLKDALVFVDDVEQSSHSGEVNVPLHDGLFRVSDIRGSIGDAIVGKVPGRKNDEITIFDSTGLAVQDLAVARLVHARAKQQGLGLQVDFLN